MYLDEQKLNADEVHKYFGRFVTDMFGDIAILCDVDTSVSPFRAKCLYGESGAVKKSQRVAIIKDIPPAYVVVRGEMIPVFNAKPRISEEPIRGECPWVVEVGKSAFLGQFETHEEASAFANAWVQDIWGEDGD